jgi:hypothetical protein
MLKTVVIAIIAALPLLLSAGEVKAKSAGVNGVACPVGTCGGSGGFKAKDVKYCKASNCPKGMPK